MVYIKESWYKTINLKRNRTFYNKDQALFHIRKKINRNISKKFQFKNNKQLLANPHFKFSDYFKKIKKK